MQRGPRCYYATGTYFILYAATQCFYQNWLDNPNVKPFLYTYVVMDKAKTGLGW